MVNDVSDPPEEIGAAFLMIMAGGVLFCLVIIGVAEFLIGVLTFASSVISPGTQQPHGVSGWLALVWLLVALTADGILAHRAYGKRFGSMWLLYGMNRFIRVFLMICLVFGMILGGLYAFANLLGLLLRDEFGSYPGLVISVVLALGMYFIFTRMNRFRLPFDPP